MSVKIKTKEGVAIHLHTKYFGLILQEMYSDNDMKTKLSNLRELGIKPTSAFGGDISYQKDVKVKHRSITPHYKIKWMYKEEDQSTCLAFWIKGSKKMDGKYIYLGNSFLICSNALYQVLQNVFYNEHDKIVEYYKVL